MAGIRVLIRDRDGTATHRAELPHDVPMRRLLPALVTRLNLPLLSPDGQPIIYHLYHDGREIGPEETLQQAAVPEDAELNLSMGVSGESARVFISYSHKDRVWSERLRTMLAPLTRGGTISCWEDTQIRPGSTWREEIQSALDRSRVAILLVTDNFLASRFIAEHEFPGLLEAARRRGLVLLWIFVSHCLYEETPIADYQAAHDISRALDELSEPEQRRVLVEVCRKIKEAVARR